MHPEDRGHLWVRKARTLPPAVHPLVTDSGDYLDSIPAGNFQSMTGDPLNG